MSMDGHLIAFEQKQREQELEEAKAREAREAQGTSEPTGKDQTPEHRLIIALLSHLLREGNIQDLATVATPFINGEPELLKLFLAFLEEALPNARKG